MRRQLLVVIVGSLLATGAAVADGTVTLDLTSPQNGTTVNPGATVNWSILVTVSNDPPGQNFGLALICVDLTQIDANPAKFDLPPADGVPAPMANFSRPEGISNPGETNPDTGYIGVQRGTPGEMNLKQIGGAQNTFGAPGDIMGTNPNIVPGVGHSGPVVVAEGSFTAPGTPGVYVFQLENALANVLDEANSPPAHSPVSPATIEYGSQSFTFTVGEGYGLGDLDCDGDVDAFDIDPFVLALTNPAEYQVQYPDCNMMLGDLDCDGDLDAFDIDPFVVCLTTGVCECP